MSARVYDYHLDGYGHVSNARHLEFLKEVRQTFFEQHSLLSTLKDIMFVVVRVDVCYRRPAAEGDELRFEGRLKGMTSRHIVLTQAITPPNGRDVAEAEITMMAVNAANGCSISIPAPLLTASKTIATE